MKIADLDNVFHRSQFPTIGTRDHPELAAVQGARYALAAAIIDDEFLLDCISMELTLLKSDNPRRGLVPFFTIPDLGIQFAFGFWPPGGTPGPHEHTAWTITAVCRNALEVLTFDRAESYRRHELVQKNLFMAPAGRTGYIYEPCIHQPKNTTNDWSLSMHVTSPRDGEICGEEAMPQLGPPVSLPSVPSVEEDHPYSRVWIARRRQEYARELARVIMPMNLPDVQQVLAQCCALASSPTRRMIARRMSDGKGQRTRGSVPVLPWRLERVHKDLILGCHEAGDMVSLDVETGRGAVEELAVSRLARDTIEFVTREPLFDVRELPGDLTDEERSTIGDMLEESGLFRQVIE
jgi:hypothetical protein